MTSFSRQSSSGGRLRARSFRTAIRSAKVVVKGVNGVAENRRRHPPSGVDDGTAEAGGEALSAGFQDLETWVFTHRRWSVDPAPARLVVFGA